MRLSLELNGETSIIEINNDSLIEHLKSSNNPENEISRLLDNGYTILNLIPPSKINCICCHKIDQLSNSVSAFTDIINTGGNSSRKGKLCEILAGYDFKRVFPNIGYKDTSGIDRSGDAIINIDSMNIMVDLKDYDQMVPYSEVDKLVRDLKVQDMELGILFSVRSKISKQDVIDYKLIDGKLIVFVACEGINSFSLMMGLKFIIHLHTSRVISVSDRIVELTNKTIGDKLRGVFERIFQVKQLASRHNEKIDEIIDKINKLMNSLKEDGINILSELNRILDIGDKLIEETHMETKSIITPFTELIDHIEAHVVKKKDKIVSIQLLNLCKDLNISMGISEKDKYIHFFKGKEDMGKLKITKTSVSLIFFNKQRGKVSYNNIYEEVKNGDYHIQLTDKPEKWDIIRSRFE